MLRPPSKAAYQLLHDGSRAMAAIERRGLKIDEPYLTKAIADVKAERARLAEEMGKCREFALWQRAYGTKMSFGSHEQLGHVIFDCAGHKRNKLIVTKNKHKARENPEYEDEHFANSEKAFKHILAECEFARMWFEDAHLRKSGEFLEGIQRETINGAVHPSRSLHLAESYRGSCSSPNFDNQPRRNKRMAEIVRTCVVPRPGYVFIPADVSGAEVRASIDYHRDPVFERYVLGGGDMHRDTAKNIFLLTDAECGEPKSITEAAFRDVAKNKFVFPGFYGADYITIAPDCWDMIDQLGLKTAQGVPVYEHLARKGIKRLGRCVRVFNDQPVSPEPGTYEALIEKSQRLFWEHFAVYAQWKRDWWDAYQREGGFNTLMGFCYRGIFRRNQVLCDPIQGDSWCKVLWCIVQLQRELVRLKMKSRIVNCIHDEIMGEVWLPELRDYVDLKREIMTERVRRQFPWITVPVQVDFGICEKTWFKKAELKL